MIVNIFGDKPAFIVNEIPSHTESNLVVAGQIYNSQIVFRQIGIIGKQEELLDKAGVSNRHFRRIFKNEECRQKNFLQGNTVKQCF